MPHHVYHTRALVVRGRNRGEADRMIELFTERFGTIFAYSRGVRRESSRLRYILQPMTWIEASVVRGEGGWRLTTANPLGHGVERNVRPILQKILHVIRAFLPAEIPSRYVFDELVEFSARSAEYPKRVLDLEVIALVRIFTHLGYWGRGKDVEQYLKAEDGNPPEIPPKARASIVREINRILRTSPL